MLTSCAEISVQKKTDEQTIGFIPKETSISSWASIRQVLQREPLNVVALTSRAETVDMNGIFLEEKGQKLVKLKPLTREFHSQRVTTFTEVQHWHHRECHKNQRNGWLGRKCSAPNALCFARSTDVSSRAANNFFTHRPGE